MTYKEKQRANERQFKGRGKVIHISAILVQCMSAGVPVPGKFTRQIVGGTYNNPERPETRNLPKAVKKANRKQRTAARLSEAAAQGKTALKKSLTWA